MGTHYPPTGYKVPPFPSLDWPPQSRNLYYLEDIWRFTVLWTLILYAIFHIGAAGIAMFMQVGKRRSHWKFIWTVPLLYATIAGLEGVIAGTVVGLVVGAVYNAGSFSMPTWIPFIWGWICVLVLIISSFSMQGGL